MTTSFLTGALTGMGFGVVLYKVGASRYSRVMGMLTLRDTKVMKFAFTAIAVAALIYGAAAALGVAEPAGIIPRTMPYMGLAHVLGGVLFGAAMGISGLCPGTCVAKAAGRGGDDRLAAPAATVGLFVGVLLYALVKPALTEAGIIAATAKPLTLHATLGLPYAPVALTLGAVLLAVIFALDRLTKEHRFEPARERRTLLDYVRGEWSWAAAGTVGGVLVVLATAQDGYLGFSGSVLALTGWIAHTIGVPFELVPRITPELIWRAALILGVIPGGLLARALSLPSKAAVEAPLPSRIVPRRVAIAFGSATMMSLGAMIGGGCTTGAFISAWPTLSLGSFAMSGTFFAVSMIVSNARLFLVHSLDLEVAQSVGDRAYD